MEAIVQRVASARVTVDETCVGEIGLGLLVFLGIARGDTEADVSWMARKLAGLRLFSDEAGRFRHGLNEAGGSLLIISQFTLFADFRKGLRPNFDGAEQPERANELYEATVAALRAQNLQVETGRFGAHMRVLSENLGPVTVPLRSR